MQPNSMIREQTGQNLYLQGGDSHPLKKPDDFLAPKETFLKFAKFLLEYNVKTKACHWKSVKLDDKSKCMPNNFFRWFFARFSKVCVFNKDLRETESIRKLAHICVKALQNLENLTGCWHPWLKELRKKSQTFFSDEEIAFLEKVFWRLPYPYRNDLVSY